MRISSLPFLASVLLVAGCGTKTHVVPLGPGGTEYGRVPADSVFEFIHSDRILTRYQPLAHISAGLGYMDGTEEDSIRLSRALRDQAGKLGAQGIVFGRDCEVPREVREHSWLPSGCVTAVRLLDLESFPEGTVLRSPMEIRRIVIAPLAVPEDLSVPDSIVEQVLGDIYSQIEAAGFQPLPLETWEEAWVKANPKGPEDPDPVRPWMAWDPEKSPEQRTLRALARSHHLEGFLFPDLVGVEAPFFDEEAWWDGTRQKVGETRSTGAKILSGIANLLIKGEEDFEEPEPSGRVGALSLVVGIENLIGARIFTGRGGIELLQKADFEGGIYVTTGEKEPEGYQIVDIPDHELFQRRNRLHRAVRLALSPLIKAR